MNKVELFNIALICFAFSFFFSNLFYRKKIKIGNKEKSAYGGLVISATVFLGILISPLRGSVYAWGILVPFFLMFILGLIDDYKHLPPYPKLIFEMVIATIALVMGFKTEIIYLPGYINYFISFIWILLLSNEFNFLDIMDGLSLSNIITIALAFTVIGLINYQPLNLLFAAVILAASLGFLPYNYRKASAYLGDSGSLSLGLLMALLAISFNYATEERPLLLLTPFILFGLPLFDFSYLTIRRALKGKSILRKSPDHIAMLIHAKNSSSKRVVYRFWLISLGFASSAILLQFGSGVMGIVALIASLFLCVEIAFKCYK
jgi:UDP-GlcNAc:undecaprenyl-phosphate/decaprenyl-phosphate GlcNAc-1-phosphate transferase